MNLKLILLSAATVLVFAAFLYGKKVGQTETLAEWQANQIELGQVFEREQLKAANEAQRIRDQLFAIESAWLEQDRQVEIEYRDRVREVVKYVEKNPAFDVCRLDGERLRHVQSAIERANDYKNRAGED